MKPTGDATGPPPPFEVRFAAPPSIPLAVFRFKVFLDWTHGLHLPGDAVRVVRPHDPAGAVAQGCARSAAVTVLAASNRAAEPRRRPAAFETATASPTAWSRSGRAFRLTPLARRRAGRRPR
jgi:hypothetical protein